MPTQLSVWVKRLIMVSSPSLRCSKSKCWCLDDRGQCGWCCYVQGAEVTAYRVQPTPCQQWWVCVGMRKEETSETLASPGRLTDKRVHFVARDWKGTGKGHSDQWKQDMKGHETAWCFLVTLSGFLGPQWKTFEWMRQSPNRGASFRSLTIANISMVLY